MASNIILIILIGVPAIAMLFIAGERHLPFDEFITTVAIGLAGIIWMLTRALSLRSSCGRQGRYKSKNG